MRCHHKDAIVYHDLKRPCKTCGRKPGAKAAGCGACIGRGAYIYPFAYDECDCGGYAKRP